MISTLTKLSILNLLCDEIEEDCTAELCSARDDAEAMFQNPSTLSSLSVIGFREPRLQDAPASYSDNTPKRTSFMKIKHVDLAIHGMNTIFAVPISEQVLGYVYPHSKLLQHRYASL